MCERTLQLFSLQVDVNGWFCIPVAIVTEKTMYSGPEVVTPNVRCFSS